MRAYLRRLRRETLPREMPGFWFSWAETAAALGYEDLKMEVAVLTKDELLDAMDFSLEDFDAVMALARGDPDGLAGFHDQKVRPFDDAIGTLETWSAATTISSGTTTVFERSRRRVLRTAIVRGALRQSFPRRRPQRSVSVRQRQEIQEVLPRRLMCARRGPGGRGVSFRHRSGRRPDAAIAAASVSFCALSIRKMFAFKAQIPHRKRRPAARHGPCNPRLQEAERVASC